MNINERITRLEELFGKPEVKNGFPSQQACLDWASQVAPLLNFNPQYHEPFLHYLQIISHPVSAYTAEAAFRNMLNQVQMAISELKQGAPLMPHGEVRVEDKPVKGSSVWKLEPSIWGMGIKLPELWSWARAKWKGKKR